MTSIESSGARNLSPILPVPSRFCGPWSPTLIIVITLLFSIAGSGLGLFVGALLTALNWYQLGFKHRMLRPLLVGVCGAVFIVIVYPWLETATLLYIVMAWSISLFAGIAIVWFDLRLQRGAVRHLVSMGGKPSAPWIPLAVAGLVLAIQVFYIAKDQAELQAESAVTRGIANLDKKNYTEAIKEFTYAVDKYPNNVYYRALRADAYFRSGQLDAALKDWSDLIRISGRDVLGDAYIRRAEIFLAKAEYDLAIMDCNEAIRIDPNDKAAYYNRGMSYAQKGDNARAEADFAKALKLGWKPE